MHPFIEQILKSPCGHLNQHLKEEKLKGKKRSKYNNKKVEFDGIIFDSQKELNRYVELRMLLRAGQISNLRLQVPYELNKGGTHSLVYKADFTYEIDGCEITEDVKGFRTKVYLKKKKLMEQVHGIIIKEV